MKKEKWIYPIIVMGFVIILLNGCDEENPDVPILITTSISNITDSSSASGGNITSDGGATIIARGVCWNTEESPTISNNKTADGTGAGNYSSIITSLSANTKYYLRAYATNNVGTAYGESISFTTLQESLPVTDIDGNVYKTVTIGTQVWMAENLKTTKYRNGDPIPNVIGEPWDNLTTGAYCIYDNNEDNRLTYGLLYNWYAVNDNRNICPEGWHIPTKGEWEILYSTGLELKEKGTTHWMSPNNCSSNPSGFKALPGGNCGYDGRFGAFSEGGYWWTVNENGENNGKPWVTNMSYRNSGLSGWFDADMYVGASVRCIKDK